MPTALAVFEDVVDPPQERDVWEDEPQAASARLLRGQHLELEAEIEKSKSVLKQSDEADDQEDTYSEETLDRAVAFLKSHIEWLWNSFGIRASIPTIGPGPNGSVDLFWKQLSWKLLVNIPASTTALATFYGDDHGQQKVKGSINPNETSYSIAAWLMMS